MAYKVDNFYSFLAPCCFILCLLSPIECTMSKNGEIVLQIPADTTTIPDGESNVVMFLAHSPANFRKVSDPKCEWTMAQNCVTGTRCQFQLDLDSPTVLTAVMKEDREFEGHNLPRWNLFEKVMATASIDFLVAGTICSADGRADNARWEEMTIQDARFVNVQWASTTGIPDVDSSITNPFVEQFQTKVVQQYEKQIQTIYKSNTGAFKLYQMAVEDIARRARRERSRDRSQIEKEL